ncbi:MAG: hypothetical protein VKN72_04740 [Nostocales cyanobacterium 94392]|nr:hypothetical protein [Nostocales cyanobacterium 94392]
MPLSPKMSVGSIIHELKHKGKKKRSRKQMVAIAMSIKGKSKK